MKGSDNRSKSPYLFIYRCGFIRIRKGVIIVNWGFKFSNIFKACISFFIYPDTFC
ncbi:hypothetical protein Hanom_Chr10g00909561 [Helianthus anomalus]